MKDDELDGFEQPEIAGILDTITNKDGERLYKIEWKESWVFEEHLKHHQQLIVNYWREIEKRTVKQIQSPNNDFNNKTGINKTTPIAQIDLQDDAAKNSSHDDTPKNSFHDDDAKNSIYNDAAKSISQDRTVKNSFHDDTARNSFLDDTTKNNFYNDTGERRASLASMVQTGSRHDTEKYKPSLVSIVQNTFKDDAINSKENEGAILHEESPMLKRKQNFNLENIVLKLKKFKHDEVQSELNSQDGSKKQNIVSTEGVWIPPKENDKEYNKEEKGKKNNRNKEISKDEFEEIYSPEYIDCTEKSSFVCQLEEKDNINYFSTLSMAQQMNDSTATTQVPNIKESSDKDCSGNLETNDKISETKCEKCNKRFYRRSQLLRHLSNHVVHECPQCNAVFYCVRKFKRHMLTHESYPCEFCEEEFYEASAWYQHRAKHTMIECSGCDMIFYNKSALIKHKLNHINYICPICHLKWHDLTEWITHRSYHSRIRGVSVLAPIILCTICRRTFSSQDIYLKHLCSHKRSVIENYKNAFSKSDITHLIGVDHT